MIYWGGGGGGDPPPPQPWPGGVQGRCAIFHDKAKKYWRQNEIRVRYDCVRVRMKLDEKYDQNFDVSNDSLNVEIHTTLQL